MKNRLSITLLVGILSMFLSGQGEAFASWTEQANTNGANVIFNGVSALDANNVWAVGKDLTNARGTIYYYDGANWTEQANTAPTNVEFFGVSALDANNVWAVGFDSTNARGTVYYYDGVNWTEQANSGVVGLRGVSALDTNDVWAVGNAFSGRLWHYDGVNWKGDIYCLNLETQIRRQITFEGGSEGDCEWSPDGKSIVYVEKEWFD